MGTLFGGMNSARKLKYEFIFEVFDGIEKDTLAGSQNIYLRTIFDMNMGENLLMKPRMVGWVNKTVPKTELTYLYVVSVKCRNCIDCFRVRWIKGIGM